MITHFIYFISYHVCISGQAVHYKKYFILKGVLIMNNTIIIIAKEEAVCRYSLSTNEEGKTVAKKCTPEAVVGSNVKAASRINALNDVVHCLQQIDKKDKLSSPIKILTIDMVLNPITNGTPLFWFANEGKTSSGEELNKKEIDLWTEFYSLYGRNVTKVIFGSVSSAVTFARNSKYPITKDMRTIAEYINSAWDDVNAKSKTVEDMETDEI